MFIVFADSLQKITIKRRKLWSYCTEAHQIFIQCSLHYVEASSPGLLKSALCSFNPLWNASAKRRSVCQFLPFRHKLVSIAKYHELL